MSEPTRKSVRHRKKAKIPPCHKKLPGQRARSFALRIAGEIDEFAERYNPRDPMNRDPWRQLCAIVEGACDDQRRATFEGSDPIYKGERYDRVRQPGDPDTPL